MKKLIMIFVVLIASFITIYSVAFWQPYTKVSNMKEYSGDGIEIEGESNDNEEHLSMTVNSNTSVYKVEKDKIREKISKEDFSKVIGISKKLSTVDIGRIEAAQQDGEEGLREVFNILNTRLSGKDYKIIESIFDPYIDFSLLKEKV